MNNGKRASVDVITAVKNFPFFVINNEVGIDANLYKQEIVQIKQNYIDYKKGSDFVTEGSSGDYIPSKMKFKISKTLIDKEARFMFSQRPDINVTSYITNDSVEEKEKLEQYQKLIDKVLDKSNFTSTLLKSAKDCFIGKRVACLVDISEDKGINVHFYNSMQFYYETEYGSDDLTKFVSFECVSESKSLSKSIYLVNKYEIIEGSVYFSSILYDGSGQILRELISFHKTELNYIPAVIIFNVGTLDDKRGVSEMDDLAEFEEGYSRLSNGDIDSERKGMNPIRFVVDMSPRSTKGLPSGAGAFWDLSTNQNLNDPHPSVGTLSPDMGHVEAVKATLDRIKTAMYGIVDVPNISEETMAGTITSGKAIKALYFPLTVRCNEKIMTWGPALEFMSRCIIDLALLNKSIIKEIYGLGEFSEAQYGIDVVPNYALLEDETEEKETDLQEIAANAMSRKSYMKKWRADLKTDAQRDEELLQIAIEQNMFDTASINTQVQTELNKTQTQTEIDNNIEDVKIDSSLT